MRPFLAFVACGLLPLTASATPAVYVKATGSFTGQVGTQLGHSVSTAGDVNGEGYADVIVGIPLVVGNTGAASVYLGGSDGIADSPAWGASGEQQGARFGEVVSTAGDVNGDGFDDVIIGAPLHDGGQVDEGRVYVYPGSATGLGSTPWILEVDEAGAQFGASVAWAGDVNGDGYDDMLAGAPFWGGFGSPFYVFVQGSASVYYGSPSGPVAEGYWSRLGGQEDMEFGAAVAGVGDVNGDGFDDVVVGAPRWDPGAIDTDHGLVRCYLGSASGLSTAVAWEQTGSAADDRLGQQVARAGDMNGDGYGDLVMTGPIGGAPLEIHYGSASGLASTPAFSGGSSGVARTGGDVNGDGYADCIVDDVSILGGGAGGPGYLALQGTWGPYDDIASAGDVDGDGRPDIIASDIHAQSNSGIVYVLLTAALPSEPATSVYHWSRGDEPPLAAYDNAGQGLAAGDVDGDGFDDLVIGIPGDDDLASNGGKVELWLGSDGGLVSGGAASPDWVVVGDDTDGLMGFAVDIAGDVNGDGYTDVVVGEAGYSRVHVFHGSDTGILSTSPAWSFELETPGSNFATVVAGAGDVNSDSYADIVVGGPFYDGEFVDEGIVCVFFGSAGGIQTAGHVTLTSGVADTWFGYDVDGVDLNGDGYSDIVVGLPNHEAVWAYHSGPFGLSGAPDWEYTLPAYGGFAWSIANGGHMPVSGALPDDGTEDMLVSVPYADDGKGYVQCILGSADGTHIFGAYTSGGGVNDNYGWSTSTAGDVDLDGVSDMFVGSLRGVKLWTVSSPAKLVWWLPDTPTTFHLGTHVAAGDFNGDGIADLAASNATMEFFQPDPDPFTFGGVWVWYGNGIARPAHGPYLPRQMTTAGEPIALGGAVPGMASSVRLAANGWSAAGRRLDLRCEAQLGPVGQPLPVAVATSWVNTGAPGSPAIPFSMDFAVEAGTDYRWRLRVVSDDPFFRASPWMSKQPAVASLVHFRSPPPPLAVEPPEPVGPALGVQWARPNPMSRSTLIAYALDRDGPVSLDVFDVVGRRVKGLVEAERAAGTHLVAWDGTDASARRVPDGVYFLRLTSGARGFTRKLIALR